MPFKPDVTYFRGDLTRPIELEKVDVVQDEGPDQGKVTSVTHIRTVDATMFDSGTGLDTANVIARGPGRLETRPDRDQPVERIAIWQDQLYLQNQLGPDGQVKQKISFSRGTGPVSSTTEKDLARLGQHHLGLAQAQTGIGPRKPARLPRHPAACRYRHAGRDADHYGQQPRDRALDLVREHPDQGRR